MLPNELVYGNYELHEVKAPTGYFLNAEPVAFVVDGTDKTIEVEKYDTAQKGRISVSKRGDIFMLRSMGMTARQVQLSCNFSYTSQRGRPPRAKGMHGAACASLAAPFLYRSSGSFSVSLWTGSAMACR